MVEVSVLMGTRNGERYISRAIESIVNQDFDDLELIICNDFSDDKTEKIIKLWQKKDHRIKLCQNERTPGFTGALNTGLSYCQGKYVARMDDDDIAVSNRIKLEYDYLETNKHVSFVGSNANYFDDNGVYGESHLKRFPRRIDVWKGSAFLHPTIMFRRTMLEKVGSYDESCSRVRIEDYDYWCRFYAKSFWGVNLQVKLLNYREDNDSFSKRTAVNRIRLVKCMDCYRKTLDIPRYFLLKELVEVSKILVPRYLFKIYHRITK